MFFVSFTIQPGEFSCFGLASLQLQHMSYSLLSTTHAHLACSQPPG